MTLALGCKVKPRQPFLHQQRLHIPNQNVSPLWLDMVSQPGAILACRGMPPRQLFSQVAINYRTEINRIAILGSIDRQSETFGSSPRFSFFPALTHTPHTHTT